MNNNIKHNNSLLLWTSSITLIFFLAIIANISPYLRGPYDSILESHWPYYFVNTYNKIWVFIPIYIGYILLLRRTVKKRVYKRKDEIFSLLFLVLLTFLFQLALVFFSRFGITILFRRLVDPGINGYFTTAIGIKDVGIFLNNFANIVNARHLAQHASGHTPGAVLTLKYATDLISQIPGENILFLNKLHPGWARDLWNSLNLHQKFSGITIPFLLHFASSLVVVPFYFVTKVIFKNSKNALITTILYSIIPSLSFFALIFDPIYAIFPLLIFLLVYKGVSDNKYTYLFLGGIMAGIGLFFTAAILTFVAALGVFCLLSYIHKSDMRIVSRTLYFLAGLSSFISITNLLGFALLSSLTAVVKNQASREYLAWVIYNPYDFFVFMGFPISIMFMVFTFTTLKNKLDFKSLTNRILYSFWIVFLLLIISGASRGEVGRIWLLFMFIPILLTGYFITTQLKFTRNQLIIFFSLVIIQVIIMEEYWVPIW